MRAANCCRQVVSVCSPTFDGIHIPFPVSPVYEIGGFARGGRLTVETRCCRGPAKTIEAGIENKLLPSLRGPAGTGT